MLHQHKCVKCETEYEHDHPFNNPDHEQFGFQCPNPACAWYQVNGQDPRVKRQVTSYLKGESPVVEQQIKQNNPTKPSSSETYAQRTVRVSYAENLISCDKFQHFVVKKATKDAKYKSAIRRPAIEILAQMTPFTEAKCSCERSACKEMWNNNAPGVFQTEFVCPGNTRKGAGDWDPKFPAKRVMPLKFRLNQDDQKFLHQRFPNWLFVCVGSGGHDHPIAHASTQVVSYCLTHEIPKGKYIDVFGSPNANEQHNREKNGRHFDSLVSKETPMDYVRAVTKWGSPNQGSAVRYHEMPLRDAHKSFPKVETYDGLIMNHSLYYPMKHEVASLLSATKGKLLYATMHRFKGEHGTLNNGEQKWHREEIHGVDHIVQENVRTGERYTHPNNDYWFDNDHWSSKTVEAMAFDEDDMTVVDCLAWSKNMMCDGTYLFTITAVPRKAMTMAQPVKSTYTEPKINSIPYVERYECVQVDIHDHPVAVPVKREHAHAFDELRKNCLNKVRSLEGYDAHLTRCVVKLRSVMKDESINVDSEGVHNLAVASFWVDAKRDKSTRRQFGDWSNEFTKNGKYNKTLKAAINVALIALRAKSLKDGVAATLSELHNKL